MILLSAATARAQRNDIAAFCHFHPDLDQPGPVFFGGAYQPGQVPNQVEALDASDWRCMDGAALLCSNSADGSTCGRLNPSRVPDHIMREICRDDPYLDSLPIYAAGRSTSVWRCRGGEPTILHTVRLDRRGYMVGAWVRYVVRNGIVLSPRRDALGEDPRWAWKPGK